MFKRTHQKFDPKILWITSVRFKIWLLSLHVHGHATHNQFGRVYWYFIYSSPLYCRNSVGVNCSGCWSYSSCFTFLWSLLSISTWRLPMVTVQDVSDIREVPNNQVKLSPYFNCTHVDGRTLDTSKWHCCWIAIHNVWKSCSYCCLFIQRCLFEPRSSMTVSCVSEKFTWKWVKFQIEPLLTQ